MLAAVQATSISSENWKSNFLSFISNRLDQIEKDDSLDSITDISKSLHHAHDVVNEIADDIHLLDICPGKAQIQDKIDVLSEGKFRRPVLMIGIDGAHAPTRHEPSPREGKRGKGEWKEAKGFRMYLLDNKEMVHLISWHQIKSDKELANDLLEIKQAGLIPEDKVRICVIRQFVKTSKCPSFLLSYLNQYFEKSIEISNLGEIGNAPKKYCPRTNTVIFLKIHDSIFTPLMTKLLVLCPDGRNSYRFTN